MPCSRYLGDGAVDCCEFCRPDGLFFASYLEVEIAGSPVCPIDRLYAFPSRRLTSVTRGS
jgi:hypothetical protein